MHSSFFRTALVLGLLSAVGPFAIDMYLPALPAIGANLQADAGAVQMSLMAFFVALGVSQAFYGPAADIYGRKAPLYVGCTLFVLCSVGCALAPNIHALVAFRFLQGVGAGATNVVPRAIVRDMHTGPDAARLMSLLMLVFSVSPMLAPLAGSFVMDWVGWRGIFWAVSLAGLLGLVLNALVLTETRPPQARQQSSVGQAWRAYGQLLQDRHFLGVCFIGGFGISCFFIYLANSSFVLINHYGLTPRQYSLAFSINALAFIGTAQLTHALSKRWGLQQLVRVAVGGVAVFLCGACVLNAAGFDNLLAMSALLFAGFGFMGLVVPTAGVLALEDHGEHAGTASALMGTLQLLCGAVVAGTVGLFADGTAHPMLTGIALSALLSWMCAKFTLNHPRVASARGK
jgi:DHA1 family bicyclomycin/chloramphenicol resistance-like MFS transporter